MKKRIMAIMLAGCVFQSSVCMASSLFGHHENENLDTDYGYVCIEDIQDYGNTAVDGYDVPQAKFKLSEEKLLSPAMGGAIVGRTMIPEGWSISVTDLSLGTESITCPNAIMATVSSPDGSCEMVYISKREFQEKYWNVAGYYAYSEDDAYDYESMMHTLDYRDSDGVCDLMCGILFGNNMDYCGQVELTEEELSEIEKAKVKYDSTIRLLFRDVAATVGTGEVIWTDVSASKRTYTDGNEKVTLSASVAGFEADYAGYGTETKYVMWSMPAIYAIKTKADAHENYQELFDMFCLSTTVSQEYEQLRDLNSQRLAEEFYRIKNSGSGSLSTGSYSDSQLLMTKVTSL